MIGDASYNWRLTTRGTHFLSEVKLYLKTIFQLYKILLTVYILLITLEKCSHLDLYSIIRLISRWPRYVFQLVGRVPTLFKRYGFK